MLTPFSTGIYEGKRKKEKKWINMIESIGNAHAISTIAFSFSYRRMLKETNKQVYNWECIFV